MAATAHRSDARNKCGSVRRRFSSVRGQVCERLHGGWGGAVYRNGGTVRRTTGTWTPAVHALLDHLESVGFEGSPRVFGIDDEGREVLTFIEGQTCVSAAGWPAWARSESNLVRVGEMMRRFHDAVESFRPASDLAWRDGSTGLAGGEIIGHNDVSLANLVADSAGHIHSLIDWDNAGPTTRRKDLAMAAWHVVALHAPAHAKARGWSKLPDVGRRLAMFLDAYGLADRDGFVDEIVENLEAAKRKLGEDAAEFVALLDADLEFIQERRAELEAAIESRPALRSAS